MLRMQWWVLFPLTLLGFCLSARPAQAARLLTISVERGGKSILQGEEVDDGIPGLNTVVVWRYPITAPLSPTGEASIRREPDGPLEALLRGNLVVKLKHGQSTSRAVKVSELRLTRQSAESDNWYLDRTWVESNDPPGDRGEEAREIARARTLETLRIPSILAAIVAVGLGWILGLASLVVNLTRRYSRPAKRLAMTALALCFASFAFSSLSHWRGSELFGGGTSFFPYASGAGLGLALIAFIVPGGPAKAN